MKIPAVSERLGHSSVMVTATVYSHRLTGRDQEAAERLLWSERYSDADTAADAHDKLEEEDRRRARELIEKRDEIRRRGYDPSEESRQLREVTESYQLDVQREAARLAGQETGAGDIKAASLASFVSSQDGQGKSEVADFEALAGSLTKEFASSAANAAKDPPQVGTDPSVTAPAPIRPGSL